MSRGTWQGSGTWSSSGPDLTAIIVPAAILSVGAGVAFIIAAIMWWLVAAFAVVVILAVWWLLTQPARKARYADAYQAAFAAREETGQRLALQRQQFALELARASAPVIQNVIDPAPFVAAALAALGVQPQPEPVKVVRSEIVPGTAQEVQR